MIASIKVLVSVFTIGAGIILTVLISIAAYIVVQHIVSSTAELDQFGTGEIVSSMPIMYLAMFFFVTLIGMLDASITNLRRFVKMRRA